MIKTFFLTNNLTNHSKRTMKKTWVKRENIYYKPFYKQKSKMLLLFIFLLGIIFFIYQALSINQLPNSSTPFTLEGTAQALKDKHKQVKFPPSPRRSDAADVDSGGGVGVAGASNEKEDAIKIIRGTRLFDYDSYKPNLKGNFKCLDDGREIAFAYVNDDFCDCTGDGSDEPSTNACNNGKFYCKYQKRHITGRGRDVFVPSSRVNDGICDCCDGSDEWTRTECRNKCT